MIWSDQRDRTAGEHELGGFLLLRQRVELGVGRHLDFAREQFRLAGAAIAGAAAMRIGEIARQRRLQNRLTHFDGDARVELVNLHGEAHRGSLVIQQDMG